MFFVLSKVLGLIFHPVNFFVLLGLFGLALCLTRFRRLGRIIAVAAGLIFAILCFSPLSNLTLAVLEDRFPHPRADMTAPTGIIVLGGSLDAAIQATRGEPTLTDAAARLTAGATLARQYPSARLVFTGGSAALGGGIDEAQGVRQLWLGLGVPAGQMIFETKSRNTYENATMTKALVEPKPGETWLLVTSAAHMPRSVGIFRKTGWTTITPYPTDYRTYGSWHDARPNANALESLEKVTISAHEWVGLVAYYLTGKTSALFPAP